MTTESTDKTIAALKKLRDPFPPESISKLPKPYKKDSPKGNCNVCGGYHGLPAVHLDYVGHAALTDRLLSVDPFWNWEPLSHDQNGLPLRDSDGGMWIKLTVCGLTRIGYGDAQGKKGPDATKEVIGDALRNAAMRFGAALELWHKGDLPPSEEDEGSGEKKQEYISESQLLDLSTEIKDRGIDLKKFLAYAKAQSLDQITVDRFPAIIAAVQAKAKVAA